MKALVILLLAGLACQVSARIGETAPQCIARYGEPFKVEKDPPTLYFTKAGLHIMIEFFDKAAALIIIQKAEQDVLDRSVELSDVEIDTLLKSNANGGTWTKVEIIGRQVWINENGSRKASYNPRNRQLMFYTQAWMDRETAKNEANEKKNLEGF